ncbi:MAG: Do family serine endopeptidase [Spirosomataceae bacterium]
MNQTAKTVAIALVSSVVTLTGYHFLGNKENRDVIFKEAGDATGIARLANFTGAPGAPGDFTYGAEVSTPGVVHIKATAMRQVRQRMPSIFEDFFGGDDFFGGPRNQQAESSGSGVIITSDGYIATNNHVVEGADELEVITSDKKIYKGKVIGTDPSTDLAVIKIEGGNFPALTFGNSDNVKVGEWVLAVGNPFNLESTVTAGIVSAKGRDISILKDKYAQRFQRNGNKASGDTPIESFIQTDAAVNPGNSGGALVNLKGELIGINTAIASPNGAYAGYAFAVPSSIVKKVTADIIKFGNVQRGYLGISPLELNSKVAEEVGSKLDEGIYVAEVPENGAAHAAGVKKGDVILKIDGIEVKSEPKFREMIGRKRPGETVNITLNRNGSVKDYSVTLRNRDGGKDFLKKEEATAVFGKLGVDLEELSATDKSKIGVSGGVKIKKIYDGEIANQTDIREGFVIVKVGDRKVTSVAEFKKALEQAKADGEEGVLLGGIYPGYSKMYYYGLGIE